MFNQLAHNGIVFSFPIALTQLIYYVLNRRKSVPKFEALAHGSFPKILRHAPLRVRPYFFPADKNAWNAACASGDLSAALKACISAAI